MDSHLPQQRNRKQRASHSLNLVRNRPHLVSRAGYARPEVIKLFSCSTQLSTKFQLLIKTEVPTNKDISWFKYLRYCIYHANKC